MSRVPVRVLSQRFGVTKDALHRHRKLHLSPQTRAALLTAMKPSDIDVEQLRRSESEGLLGSLIAQRARLAMLSEMCFEQGELHAATSVEARITQSLELTSRLLGMIIQHHEVRSTSVLLTADYLKLRGTIISALRPFPEAARAVGAALAALETEAAKDIISSKRPILLEASPC